MVNYSAAVLFGYLQTAITHAHMQLARITYSIALTIHTYNIRIYYRVAQIFTVFVIQS